MPSHACPCWSSGSASGLFLLESYRGGCLSYLERGVTASEGASLILAQGKAGWMPRAF